MSTQSDQFRPPLPTAGAGTFGLSGVASRKPVAPGASGSSRNSTQRIVESITTAIVQRRLMPGTKLGEQKIADLFKVSRTLVRQAFNQLTRDRLIELQPGRGAFVATPGVEEARQVFELRQMLEGALIGRLCSSISHAQINELRAHLKAEDAAVARTDVSGRTRLLADFHIVLARMLNNTVLAELLADLLSRSQLISLMYQSSHSAAHSQAEHVLIVDALERRDAIAAAALMQSHLVSVQQQLRLEPCDPDLGRALGIES